MTIITEQNEPQQEPKNRYQLYREDVNPCRWYLVVNGNENEKLQITSCELASQSRFRTWHFDHGLKPPESVQKHLFENRISGLYDAAIKYEATLPFMQTGAGMTENLMLYFDTHVGMGRTKGTEFMEGRFGDSVRVIEEYRRIYFKWQPMRKFWIRAFNSKEAEIDILKMFITMKGGYQGEKDGRDWFRCTYWLPWDLFDEETVTRWFTWEKEV
jgi:hypothetical protein